ncbi:hypothetical protein QQS21_011692 [Conoideocrella luteorostrata]|uniref:ABC transporter domain-containing protein n=1 Tax=Conoideocrella luteorostrata TaxID=1105319 RepID=A0AAJ0CCU8_9HYPO|nr:hypothetical protein QQS21_011692 [Conoideocrella luteorostrata]
MLTENVVQARRMLHRSPSTKFRYKYRPQGDNSRANRGKSSLILTPLNFLDYAGVIGIDGVDLSEIPRQHLRSYITKISQDLVELPGTVRYNLLPVPGTESADSELVDKVATNVILRREGLLDYINQRGGLDAPSLTWASLMARSNCWPLHERCCTRSKKGSKILLVDEATSSMDAETARTMEHVLDDVFGDCTRIVMSHRPEMVQNSDFIVTMQDGK